MTGDQLTFEASTDEHSVCKVRSDDTGFPGTSKGNRQIASSAAKIEDESFRAIKNGPQKPGGARAPKPIELQRKKMIEQIVARCNLREHFADFARSVSFGNGALGHCSLDRCGNFSHGALVRVCCSRW